jgi:hypothetical protein
VFSIGYLVFLVYPVMSELSARRPARVLVPVLLAAGVFVALDLFYWARHAWVTPRRGEALGTLVALGVIALSLTLHDAAWIWLFIYCVVAAGAAPVNRRQAAAMAGLLVLLVIALGVHYGPSPI